MSIEPIFRQPLSHQVHDDLLHWLESHYGFHESWQTLWLNNHALGKVSPKWEAMLKKDWDGGLHQEPEGIRLHSESWLSLGDHLQNLALHWKQIGVLQGWRNELFDVCDREGRCLFSLERAAFRPLGLMSHAVHLNGLTFCHNEWHFWIGRRSAYKAVDPNKLDNLVGGGVASNESVQQALQRETEEEAGILLNDLDCPLASKSRLHSLRPVARGLHNEILHIFDLVLAPSVRPQNQDGEVDMFERMSVPEVVEAMSKGVMMADAQLVTLDAFLRYGLISLKHPLSQALIALQRPLR